MTTDCEHGANQMFTAAQVFQGFINFWNLVRLIPHKLQDSPALLSYCSAVFFQIQAWQPSQFHLSLFWWCRQKDP